MSWIQWNAYGATAAPSSSDSHVGSSGITRRPAHCNARQGSKPRHHIGPHRRVIGSKYTSRRSPGSADAAFSHAAERAQDPANISVSLDTVAAIVGVTGPRPRYPALGATWRHSQVDRTCGYSDIAADDLVLVTAAGRDIGVRNGRSGPSSRAREKEIGRAHV